MHYLESFLIENNKFITNKFSSDIKLIDSVFEIETELLKLIEWTLLKNVQATNNTTRITLNGFYKSLISIYDSFKLNINGQYGSARILLRHAFEYLIIAKYCSVSKDISLVNKWESGEDISLGREVFSKLETPLPKQFRMFWGLLCQFTHATKYSQQSELDASKNEYEISINFVFIEMLLEMNYHLFNRHFINNSMKFYFEHYGNYNEVELYKAFKIEIKTLFSLSKKDMSKESKAVIKNYVSNWVLKK